MKHRTSNTSTTSVASDDHSDEDSKEHRHHWPTDRQSFLSVHLSSTAFNFIFLFGLVYTGALIWGHFQETGLMFDAAVLRYILSDIHVVLAVNMFFTLWTAFVYFLVKLIALGVLKGFRAPAYTLYSLIQVGVLFGSVALLYTLEPHFTPFAGCCVTMQCAVYAILLVIFVCNFTTDIQ